MKKYKRPKNHKDSSEFEDLWTELIALTCAIISKKVAARRAASELKFRQSCTDRFFFLRKLLHKPFQTMGVAISYFSYRDDVKYIFLALDFCLISLFIYLYGYFFSILEVGRFLEITK